jgi:hypothetical protein
MADNVGKMITTFKKKVPYFHYNDFMDNDSNYYNTNGNSKVDRMIWIDWDFDKKIDMYAPTAPVHMHIGDSLFLLKFSKIDSVYRFIGDITDKTDKRYQYRGRYTYEFIGGDWGVDEEIMDGKDNDLDGSIDDDTRIVSDTLDDDGDFFKRDLSPMVWRDSVIKDSRITINDPDTKNWDTVVVLPEFKTLYSAIYIQIYGKELPAKLKRYKVKPPKGEFVSGDYGLDEEWYDGVDNDGDGLIDEDVGERIPPAGYREEIIESLRQNGSRGDK